MSVTSDPFRKAIPALVLTVFLSCAAGPRAVSWAAAPEMKPQVVKADEVGPTLEEARREVDVYVAALEDWMYSPEPGSFEPILARGQAAAEAVLAVEAQLDADAFTALGKKMRGYLLQRTDLVVAVPDAGWLKEQAAKHGLPADTAFFDLMGQTLNGYWPVTMEQLSDLSGCSRYGSHDLVRLYGAWKNFEKQYPGAYTAALKDPKLLLLADIEDQLVNGLSACESPASVIDEFQAFIAAYPDSDLTPKLKKRLEELKKNESGMAFYQGNRYNGPAAEAPPDYEIPEE